MYLNTVIKYNVFKYLPALQKSQVSEHLSTSIIIAAGWDRSVGKTFSKTAELVTKAEY